MKRYLVTTVAATLLFASAVSYAGPAAPANLAVVTRKTIIRTLPVELQTPTDTDCYSAMVWLLAETLRAKAECVKVEKSGDSPIQGVFCTEDLLEAIEEGY